MAISNKTRKILWAKSGNKCAICKQDIVKNTDYALTVIGNECHIISEKTNGPRYKLLNDYNIEDNLILLCANDHKMIDDNVSYYTVEKLKKIKKDHVRWVETKHKDNISVDVLYKVKYTRDLVLYIIDSDQFAFNYPSEMKEHIEIFKNLYSTIIDIDGLGLDEFAMIEYLDDIVNKILNLGYVILTGQNIESFGKHEMITSLIYIKTHAEYNR